jgi:hypothetical protein
MNPSVQTVDVPLVDDHPVWGKLHPASSSSRMARVYCSKPLAAPPDLITTDDKMPGLAGPRLYERLRHGEATRNTPFSFVGSRAISKTSCGPWASCMFPPGNAPSSFTQPCVLGMPPYKTV